VTVSRTGAKRRRADAGFVRVTQRDIELLRFAGEQYAVSMPQLERMMGASHAAAHQLKDRWRRGGWGTGRVMIHGKPVFVWPTREGLALAGLPFGAIEPSPGRIAHIEVVVDVRLWVEWRRPNAVWESERYIQREVGGGLAAAHRPDALVTDEGQTVAVEVELTLKPRQRLEAIVASTLSRYPAVWYFAAPGPKRALEEIAEQVGRDRLLVLPLPPPS